MTPTDQNNESSMSFLSKWQDDDPEASLSQLLGHDRRYPRIRLLLHALLLALASWALVDLSLRLARSASTLLHGNNGPCWCGTSNGDAIALGCRYDHLAVDWLPLECIDQDLVEEFDRSGPNGSWPYFELDSVSHSGYHFTPVNATLIDTHAAQGKEYWATRRWHVLHCMFTWRKQFRAGLSLKPIEPWNNHEEHIEHCTKYILEIIENGGSLDAIDTVVPGESRHPEDLELG